MNPALGASICLLGLVYPFAVYIGVERWPSAWLPAAMACSGSGTASTRESPGRPLAAVLAVAGCLALAAVDSPAALRAYPVMMNALLLAVFGISLLRGQTVIERLARLRHADLPAAGVRYAESRRPGARSSCSTAWPPQYWRHGEPGKPGPGTTARSATS